MPYIVEVTVKSQRGTCAFGHKVGDKIVFDGKSIKGDICYSALMVLLPKVYAVRYGTEFLFTFSLPLYFQPNSRNDLNPLSDYLDFVKSHGCCR